MEDSLIPVYPFIAEISTLYSLKVSSLGVPPIFIAICALPFKLSGAFSIVKFIPLGRELTSIFVISFWFSNELMVDTS